MQAGAGIAARLFHEIPPAAVTGLRLWTSAVAMAVIAGRRLAQQSSSIPGAEVDTFFGCWLDINQPQQSFLPLTPPPGNFDGPWTGITLGSVNQAITPGQGRLELL